ncbi:MAG: hypothetical protein IT374_18060 [Polyangiaceae bacterium]|nr:hypothetical protein [Polyangiaceae bacterium]
MVRALTHVSVLSTLFLAAACSPADSSGSSGGQAGQAQGAAGSTGVAGSTSNAGGSGSGPRQQCVTLTNIKKYIADGLELYCLPCLMTVPSCCTALAACDADADCPTCVADTVKASELCVDTTTFMSLPPYADVMGCDTTGICLSKCSATSPGTCEPGDPGYPNCY